MKNDKSSIAGLEINTKTKDYSSKEAREINTKQKSEARAESGQCYPVPRTADCGL